MERFFCRAEVVRGEGALGALETWKGGRAMLVTEGGPEEEMLRNLFREILRIPVEEDGCDAGLVRAGAERGKAWEPRVLVALGGRAAMNCAKAMALLGAPDCPLVMVPTVPASGAESSGWVTVTRGSARRTLREGGRQPELVILDPALFRSCGRKRLAQEGISLLSDALESCSARGAGAISRLLARDAFCGTWASLPAAVLGNRSARERLQLSSVLAGMAYDRSGLGLCHAMAAGLADRYRLGTGILKAILLPEILACNACGAPARYVELARAAGLGGSTEQSALRNLRAGLLRLRRELGLPETLAQAGIPPGEVWHSAGALAREILADGAVNANPLQVDDFMIRRILDAVTGRL